MEDFNNMTQDVDSVQKEGTVSTETVSKTDLAGAVAPDAVVNQAQPLTQEAISKQIEDALAPIKEATKREIQSVKDKAKTEVDKAIRKAELAENTLNQARAKLRETNPEVVAELEAAELKETVRHYKSRDAEEQTQQQFAQFDQTFKTNVNQFVTELGLDPNDKRIDWGDDAKDYLDKQSRILKSVTAIQKAETKKADEKRSQEVKDIEARLRKDLGLDSVDTGNPVGATVKNDDRKLKDRYPSMK
jgi:hypothetical protein